VANDGGGDDSQDGSNCVRSAKDGHDVHDDHDVHDVHDVRGVHGDPYDDHSGTFQIYDFLAVELPYLSVFFY